MKTFIWPCGGSALLIGVVSVCTVDELQQRDPASAQSPFALASLTVPTEGLGTESCTLSPAPSMRLGDNRVRGGLWTGLPIPSNPWTGTDPAALVAIRERVVSSPSPPDGPPLSGAELARFRRQLADDVEEAYAAIYTDGSATPVTVHAVRFKETAPPRRSVRNDGLHYFELDRTIVVVSGDITDCFNAVRAHVAELTGR